MQPSDEIGHLSIGEVLSLLQSEFPDVTISKIRFLEAQGLIDPERTPSGYRKFYEADIVRLRWILRQQRDNFLPLKVIKSKLEGGDVDFNAAVVVQPGLFAEPAPVSATPVEQPWTPKAPGRHTRDGAGAPFGATAAVSSGGGSPEASPSAVSMGGADAPAGASVGTGVAASAGGSNGAPGAGHAAAAPPSSGTGNDRRGSSGVATSSRDAASPNDAASSGPAASSSDAASSGPAASTDAGSAPPLTAPPAAPSLTADDDHDEHDSAAWLAALQESPKRAAVTARPAPEQSVPVGRGVRFGLAEVVEVTGVPGSVIEEMVSYGLVAPNVIGGEATYDAASVAVVRAVNVFLARGVEPRHLRMFKNAADREAGFYEQMILPLLKQRNPKAREQASSTLGELTAAGDELGRALVRQALRAHLGE